MTDKQILALSAQCGTINDFGKTFFTDDELLEFASLLREKFIADLGEPVAYRATIPNKDGTYHWAFGEVKGSSLGVAWYTPLYALPKDKDERK